MCLLIMIDTLLLSLSIRLLTLQFFPFKLLPITLHCTLIWLIYLLTHSMEQSPSWKTNQYSASQDIPRILRNPKVYNRFHNCPQPVPILSQFDLVHTPTSHFLKIYLNIMLPSMPGSPKWSLSLRFPHQNTVYTSPLAHTRYMHHPPHSSQFYHQNIIGWGVQINKLLIMQFSPLPFYLVGQNISSTSYSQTSQPTFLRQCEWPSFILIPNNRQNYSSVILSL